MDGRGREWATPVLNNYLTTVTDRGPEAGDDGAKFGPMHTDHHSLFTHSPARSLHHSLTHSRWGRFGPCETWAGDSSAPLGRSCRSPNPQATHPRHP